ncbi:unnamed protein product [Amoebophrya sp. A120]|nr:unnamed protein product [Amoebophrya sp. A120]|eukprot:GSA120T00002040001.1
MSSTAASAESCSDSVDGQLLQVDEKKLEQLRRARWSAEFYRKLPLPSFLARSVDAVALFLWGGVGILALDNRYDWGDSRTLAHSMALSDVLAVGALDCLLVSLMHWCRGALTGDPEDWEVADDAVLSVAQAAVDGAGAPPGTNNASDGNKAGLADGNENAGDQAEDGWQIRLLYMWLAYFFRAAVFSMVLVQFVVIGSANRSNELLMIAERLTLSFFCAQSIILRLHRCGLLKFGMEVCVVFRLFEMLLLFMCAAFLPAWRSYTIGCNVGLCITELLHAHDHWSREATRQAVLARKEWRKKRREEWKTWRTAERPKGEDGRSCAVESSEEKKEQHHVLDTQSPNDSPSKTLCEGDIIETESGLRGRILSPAMLEELD